MTLSPPPICPNCGAKEVVLYNTANTAKCGICHNIANRKYFLPKPRANPRPGEDAITQGRVKTFNTESGYGFIIASEVPQDVFFHRTLCKHVTVCPGDDVTFGYRKTEDGRYRATRIIKVEGSDA